MNIKYSNPYHFIPLVLCILTAIFFNDSLNAQIVINEGSNKNFSVIADEDGDYNDWIELYNSGNNIVSLLSYSLTDNISNPTKWVFPNILLAPGEFKTVFCSDKNRKPTTSFVNVLSDAAYTPSIGWNTHTFSAPFFWDGVSNILINVCSYATDHISTNAVFNQTLTPYYSTVYAHQNFNPAICTSDNGVKISQRPNIKINNHIVGSGVVQNTATTYPAPYGNAFSAAKHQILIKASELASSGLTAGNITSLAFDVVSADLYTEYDYIDISMKNVSYNEVSNVFEPLNTSLIFHTNFKIDRSGETVYLFSPSHALVSSLNVKCRSLNVSTGSFPDAASNITYFKTPTPAATNNLSSRYSDSLLPPVFSLPSGLYGAPVNVSISNPNTVVSSIHYTLDGSEPTITSLLYTGSPINMFYYNVLKAAVFADSALPSRVKVSSYLVYVNHTTPVLNVITDDNYLHGPTGIFDNYFYSWKKPAYVEYFDSTGVLIFSQFAAIQMDGGWSSRTKPQSPFRVDLDDPVLGDGPVENTLIPNKSNRKKYSKFFLRNGGAQFLSYPFMDAFQTEAMGGETNNCYSGWRPVSVYINGGYFGLYELREKIDAEFFEELENADADSVELLTQNNFAGCFLRPLKGSVDSFYSAYNAFKNLNTADTSFWNLADNYFDMTWYNDYIIGESWVGNTDWLTSNISIYRSDKTAYRWRFCLLDMECALYQTSNAFKDSYFDHIAWMLNYNNQNPYISIWQKSMQNIRFKNYFINRFADLMNTSYLFSRLEKIDNNMYAQTIDEMTKEFNLYKDTCTVSQLLQNFNDNHNNFLFQLSKRTEQVRNHIQNHFSLSGQVDVTLDVTPAGAGKIKINTVFPDSLPWTGVYFNGNPVTITAFPLPGYNFAYWDTNAVLLSRDSNSTLNINITSDALFNAVFTSSPYVGALSISELNYHSDSTLDTGDWIEFHNYGNGPMDISGWKFSDSKIYNKYIFPQGAVIQPGERVVLAEDTLKFHIQHPGIAIMGPFVFSFSNSNELLTLSDFSDEIKLQMHYDDSLPWPSAADGFGRTLELVNDTLNPASHQSWFVGCMGGSPGAHFTPCNDKIIFSEINYKSSPSADAGDWVEIHNKSTLDIDISGWTFKNKSNVLAYTIPAATVLPADGYLVLFNNIVKFNAQFPVVTNKKGPFNFGLDDADGAVRLFDANGFLVHSVAYNKNLPWPQGANGNGYTLEIVDPESDSCIGANWYDWFDGCPKGSPGGPYTLPCSSAFINSAQTPLPLKVFPNPSDGSFYIVSEGNIETINNLDVEVFNLLGEKVFSKHLSKYLSHAEIFISNAPGGVYTVRISNPKNLYLTKIVLY